MGTLEDYAILKEHWGKQVIAELLLETPPGIVSPRSWNYWNLMLRPDQPILPIPVRHLPG